MSQRGKYLRRLENPYATLDVEEERDPRRQYIFLLQNPYANLEVDRLTTVGPSRPLVNSRANAPARQPSLLGLEPVTERKGRASKATLSKAEFEAKCRAIFRQYTPFSDIRHRLRAEYTEFIFEGKALEGPSRFAILSELQRYDLATLGEIRPYLNREREAELRSKLKSILDKAKPST